MTFSRRPSRIVLGVVAVVVIGVAALIVVAIVKQHRIEQTPASFPRAEPRFSDRRAPWPPRFGVNANMAAEQGDDALRTRQFRAIAAGGLGWVRINFVWPWTEPERGRFDFTKMDTVVREAAAAGLALQAVLQFTPTWASTLDGSERTPAKDPADTDRWVRASVERYGPGGTFWGENRDLRARPIRVWEIWNEPNVRHFFAPKSGRTYAHHAVVVARAIRSVDPAARILFGGLSGQLDGRWEVDASDDFLVAALDAQPSLKRLLDGVALHGYGDANRVGSIACTVREAMDRHGMSARVLVFNEFGGVTSGKGAVSEQQRSAWIGSTVARLVTPGGCPRPLRVVMIAPYTWWSPRRDPGNFEQWFGLADDTGKPLPSGLTYLQAAAGADRAYPRSQDR